VIDALCRAGRLDDAMSQFNQMINEGQSPDISCFLTCGNWEKAEVLFFEMLDRDIRLDAIVFYAMMHNLRKEGRVMEAQKCLT
jgi:pentatricopeptide repeat protein